MGNSMTNIYNKSMKLIFLIIAFTLNVLIIKAQDPIIVTITGTCNLTSGEFLYDGTLNGKNNYTREYTDGTGTFYFHVSYDTTQWVCYVDEDIHEMAFYNSNVPNEMLPPNTGWIADICSDGTMEIEGGISIGLSSFIRNKETSIYVSSDNYLNISFKSPIQTQQNLRLYNLLGQCVSAKTIEANSLIYKIDLSDFKTGIYIVNVLGIIKKVFVH